MTAGAPASTGDRARRANQVTRLILASDRNNPETYAQRWLELVNYDLVKDHNPYYVPFDAAVQDFASRGQKLVSFSHYDYLGLAGHKDITSAACEAIMTSGTGVGASRMVGGERAAHREFERDLADFLRVDDLVSLVSGYGTNVSLLGHMLGKRDLIVSDELSHNSILAGTKLSRALALSFEHNDLDSLEYILKTRRSEFTRALIVIEGMYSMDGDIPDLERVFAIRDKYNAWLMIDEAHSIGVLGATGRGVSEHFNVDPNRIDFIIGTLSKTFVSCGGFIGTRKLVAEWLRYTLPGFIYSVGLAPPIVASAHAALRVFRNEPQRVAKMRRNSLYFLERAREAGLEVGDAIGAGVVPVIFDSVEETMRMSHHLMAGGFYVPPIVHVGVPKDKPRLRFFISEKHTFEDMDRVIATMLAFTAEGAGAAPVAQTASP